MLLVASRAQACSFRDSYEDFCKLGATVVGISKGGPADHQEFRKKNNLPFMLLCDEQDKAPLRPSTKPGWSSVMNRSFTKGPKTGEPRDQTEAARAFARTASACFLGTL